MRIAPLLPLLLAAHSALAFQTKVTARSFPSRIHSTATGDAVSDNTADDSSDSLIEFPPPLTGLQRTKRAIEFYKRALPVLAAYKAKEIELKLRPAASEEEEQKIWNELDEWGSTTIAESENFSSCVLVGCHLLIRNGSHTMPYLFPTQQHSHFRYEGFLCQDRPSYFNSC